MKSNLSLFSCVLLLCAVATVIICLTLAPYVTFQEYIIIYSFMMYVTIFASIIIYLQEKKQ